MGKEKWPGYFSAGFTRRRLLSRTLTPALQRVGKERSEPGVRGNTIVQGWIHGMLLL